MQGRLGQRLASTLAWWVERVRRHAVPVVAAAVVAAGAGGYYTANHLNIMTDTADLLSRELPFQRTHDDFKAAFPQLDDNLVIVVDGQTADQAEDAALALAERLERRTDLFKDVYYAKGDPFFRNNGLLFLETDELEDLANRLAEAQPLISTLTADMSLRGLFDVLGRAAEKVVEGETDPGPLVRVYDMIGDTVEARLKGQAAKLSWRELMSAEPLEPSERREILVVQPKLDYASLKPAASAIDAIRQIATQLRLDASDGTRVRITGSTAIKADELKSVKTSASRASLISLVLVSLVVFLGLRSPRLVFATVATLVLSLIWTATFAALAIGHLNLLSVGFAVLFIGLAVDFSIQFSLRYKERIVAGRGHAEALRGAAAGTGVAISLAALCAAIGFFAFLPTAYVGLSELGVIAGVGMFFGLFGTLTVLPALLTLLPPRRMKNASEAAYSGALGNLISHHAPAICAGTFVLGVVALAALPAVRFDYDPIHLRDPATESVQTYIDLAGESRSSPYSIDVLARNLDAARAVAERLDRLAVVDSTVTLNTFVPEGQAEKLGIIDQMVVFLTPILEFSRTETPSTPSERRRTTADFRTKLEALSASPNAGDLARPALRLDRLLERFAGGPGREARAYVDLEDALLSNLPGRLESLRQAMYARFVGLEDLPENLGKRYVARDGRARVEVFPVGEITEKEPLRRFATEVRQLVPEATGAPVAMFESGEAIIDAFAKAGTLALAMISLLLVAVLRSLRDSLLVLTPLVLAAVLAMAFTVVFDVPLNFANVVALPLLFSLGVAFGIYLVLRYREAGSVTQLLRTSTPRAVVFSALTTMASFGTFMVSSHRGMASLGELLVTCLTLALVCTLGVLPALLAWRAQGREARSARGGD